MYMSVLGVRGGGDGRNVRTIVFNIEIYMISYNIIHYNVLYCNVPVIIVFISGSTVIFTTTIIIIPYSLVNIEYIGI